jgi:hypothetical protein
VLRKWKPKTATRCCSMAAVLGQSSYMSRGASFTMLSVRLAVAIKENSLKEFQVWKRLSGALSALTSTLSVAERWRQPSDTRSRYGRHAWGII